MAHAPSSSFVKWCLAAVLAALPSLAQAIPPVQYIWNAYSDRHDAITQLSTTSIRAGTNITVTTTSTGVTISASGGSPGGSDSQIQFNQSGTFAGSANLVYDSTNVFVGIGNGSPQNMLHLFNSGTAPGIILENTSLTLSSPFDLFDIRWPLGLTKAKYRFRTFSVAGNLGGFTWEDNAGNERAKIETANSRFHIGTATQKGIATLNVGGDAVIGSGLQDGSTTPPTDGLVVQGASVFQSSATFGSGAVGIANSVVTVQAPTDAAVPLSIKAHSATHTGNLQEWKTSAGVTKVFISPNAPAITGDNYYIAVKPGTREYQIGSYDLAGYMFFARSDQANALLFTPNTDYVAVRSSAGYLYITGNASPGLVLTPYEAGGTGILQIGRRATDGHPAVGASVEFWPTATQTLPIWATVKAGNGTGFGSPVAYRLQAMRGTTEDYLLFAGESSATNAREQASIVPSWTTSTDASRKARLTFNVYDTSIHEGLYIESDGSSASVKEKMGASVSSATMTEVGVANVQTSAAGIGNAADTTDDTLFTYTLSTNSMSANGKSIRILASGHFATNANPKRLKIWFAGTAISDSGAVTLSNTDWKAEAELTRIDSTHVSCVGTFTGSNVASVITVTPNLAVSDLTANNSIIKTTGNSTVIGAASDTLGYLQKTWFEN